MKVYEQPYRHIKCYDFLPPGEYGRLVDGLPLLDWELYCKSSYNYHVSSIDYETQYYKVNQEIVAKFISADFIRLLSGTLEIDLDKCKNFTFHRMDVGDFSFRHTDKNQYGELARVVYFLTEPGEYQGGDLKLFDLSGKEIHEVLRMPANSFFSFRLTDKFYHEVETVTDGSRYCISITYH